jgi:DNA-binding SARP family transcriptional activator
MCETDVLRRVAGEMKSRAKLNLRVLGGFEARVDSGPVLVLPTKKTQALLTYLALPPGRSHPRDKLASLLWGDMPDAQALGNLRQALTRIRRVLPRPVLRALVLEGKTVALEPSLVEVDAARFEQLVADGKPESLGRAATVYQGELLTGVTLSERSFEDWLTSQRERLHELALQAFARLLAHQQEAGLAEPAMQTGLRLLAMDPLQEPVHRAVMRLYAQLGRRAAALRQYQRCVSILRHELATEPELETQRLYQEILRQHPARREAPLRARSAADPLPGLHAPSMFVQSVANTPLIGREDDLGRLHAALEAALSGRSLLVAVLGEAGIGKTRLLGELASVAAQRGVAILVGHAYESEQILPYGPWIDAFRSTGLFGDTLILDKLNPGVRAEMMRLVPTLGDRSAAVSESSEPSQVFSAVAQTIGELATRQPVLVILEDLQWADEMTLRLVAFLTRALPPRPVLLAASARAEALVETPMLNRILDELSRDKRLVRLDLEPLSERATLRLADLVASGRGTREALATLGPEIWRVSEGNPFVVVETLQALERGTVPEAAPLSVPARVRALVAGRLERLSESERQLVSVAAVIGRRFSFRLLHQAVGLDEAEIAAVVEKLVRHSVFHGVGESFDFMHDRIRTVAYDLLLPPHRAVLHRRVARALEVVAEHDPPSQHLMLGTHYRLGEVWDQALMHLSAAGRMAAARGAHQESVTCYDLALQVLEHLPKSDDLQTQTTALLIDLGDSLHNLGEFHRASAIYERAEQLAAASGDEARLVRIWSGQAYADVSLGKYHAGVREGERALQGACVLGDIDLEIWTRASLVRGHDALGNYRQAADVCRATIPLLQRRPRDYLFGPAFVLLHVHVRGWLAVPLSFLGDFDEAMHVALESVEIAEHAGRDRDRAWAYSCLGRVHQERGQPDQAIRCFEQTLDLSRDMDRRFYRVFAGFLGLAYAQAGRIEEGVAMTAEGMARIETMQYFRARPKYLEMQSMVMLAAGRFEDAERAAIAALASAREQTERGHEAWVLRLLGELACFRTPADLDRAATNYREADAIARELGMRPLQARCHLALGELHVNAGRPDAARAELAAADELFAAMAMTNWRRRVNAVKVLLRSSD